MEDKREELRQAPSRDLIAVILEEVLKVSQGAKNLKGTYVKVLNTAYVALRSAAGVMAVRTEEGREGTARESVGEVETLRLELARERREKESLLKKTEKLEERVRRLEVRGIFPLPFSSLSICRK